MPKIALRPIPEPASGTRSVLVGMKPPNPYMIGPGGDDYVCGNCGYVLLKACAPDAMTNIVLHCPGCQAFNDT